MNEWGRYDLARTERDEGIRRTRRLRNGIVAVGVAGSLGLAGVAAAATIGGRQTSSGSASNGSFSSRQGSASGGSATVQQPQPQAQWGDDGFGEGSGEGGDDGGQRSQQSQPQQSQPQFQQPQAPSAGNTGSAPQATTTAS